MRRGTAQNGLARLGVWMTNERHSVCRLIPHTGTRRVALQMCPNTRRSHNGEFDARRPCQIAVLASLMLCLRIISFQHDALTGAASCVRFVLRTGPARAGKAHGDMCDGIGPIGACPRPAHSSRGRSAGRPLSMGARKSRFCACPQHAVRCARNSGPSPIPCQVPGLKIMPLSRAHGRRTLCLRERRKPWDRVQVGRQGFVERSCRSDSPMGVRLEAHNREARSIGQTEINV